MPGLSRGRGLRGHGSHSEKQDGPETDVWERGRILPVRAPFATIVWDYINRGMPLNREGTLTADEVYGLTAYLLSINQVIPEDQVLDRESLPKVKMPLASDEYASLPRLEAEDAKAQGLPVLAQRGGTWRPRSSKRAATNMVAV